MATTPAPDVISSPAGDTAPANSIPQSDAPVSIPPEVLEIPAMYGLLHGAPPAIYAPTDAIAPEFDIAAKYAPQLVEAGFGFYTSADKKLGVMFNTTYVTEEELRTADKAGKLTEIAVPYETVKSNYGAAITGEPVSESAAPIAGGSATAAAGSPPSGRAQARLTTARVNNLSPGGPTSGARPGAGRILNNVLKNTI